LNAVSTSPERSHRLAIRADSGVDLSI
jgi:hypothetical protein